MIKRSPFAPRRREEASEPDASPLPPREQNSSRQPNAPNAQPPALYGRSEVEPTRPPISEVPPIVDGADPTAGTGPSANAGPGPGAVPHAQQTAVDRPTEKPGEVRDQRSNALTPVNDPNVHVATMGGRQVAALRKRTRENDTIVECIVLPSGALRVTPTSVGPFEFLEDDHAEAFITEVLTSLSVLGCHITRGGERRATEPPPGAEAEVGAAAQ